MNKHSMLHNALRAGLKHDDCRVYSALLALARNWTAAASLSDICRESCVHRFSVQRSIKSLCELGLIAAEKSGTKKTRYTIKFNAQLSAVERTAKRARLSAVEPPVDALKNDLLAYKERARARKALSASPSKSTPAGKGTVVPFRRGVA